jgi:hypothetical protein
MACIEVLNVNVDLMATSFDDDGANEMALGLDEVSRPMVSSIFTPSTPTPSRSIIIPNIANPKTEVAWGLIKVQLNFN